MQQLDLPNGYYELPTGKLANVVTCLEMETNPQVMAKALPAGYSLQRVSPNDLTSYRVLFRKIGEDLMWFSRLIMPDEMLKAILSHKDVESYALYHGDMAIGVMELDFKDMPNCELAFFGLSKEAVGSGLGRILMNLAIERAWAKPIKRFWVHTCHFDHPNAIGFYQRSGFKPYSLMVEVHDDPRLQGKLPRTASPHVALIDPYC
jgi:GNAT superfamily N-acetyltransferase